MNAQSTIDNRQSTMLRRAFPAGDGDRAEGRGRTWPSSVALIQCLTVALVLALPTPGTADETVVSGITPPPKLTWNRIAAGGTTLTSAVAGSAAVSQQYVARVTVGQPEASNLKGGGYRLTAGFWAPALPPPPGNPVWNPDPTGADRTTRSLRFRVTAATSSQDAIKVTMVDLQNPVPPNALCCPPQNFSAYESATCTDPGNCARWVGKPGTFLESQDTPALGNYRAARLQCTPFYYDWITETGGGPITVVGAEVLPSSQYSVQTYGSSCTGSEGACTNVSTAVTMYTRRSGDVESLYNPPDPSGQPNAIDIAQLVAKFKNTTGAPVKARAQIQPNLPEMNGDISALDISAVVDAVKGMAYPFSGPCPCPSAVVCGATACPSGVGTCTTEYGPGAMCVKTCSGGANDGQPCVDNNVVHNHCPGGTCGNPMCRDRCGRCTP